MPKTTSTKNTTEKKVVEKTIDKDLKAENSSLKNELDELKALVQSLISQKGEIQKTEITKPSLDIDLDEDFEDEEIKPSKYIKVMSLLDHTLVLSTQGFGKGKIFKFNKFGEIKTIVYADLAEIIHHQQSFVERGDFYIFDKAVVRRHGLSEYYKKILTKEIIENILSYATSDVVSIFKNATLSNQDTIVSILMRKIRANEEIDLNKVDAISRVYGKNIYEIATEELEFEKENNDEE